MKIRAAAILVLVAAFFPWASPKARAGPQVSFFRVPNGGVQPQVAADSLGSIHLIYLTGAADQSDIFYMRSIDGGSTFSPPIRVNSQRGSAMAIGTVRGAHLAAGRDGRAHVAWMGSSLAQPKGPDGAAPMLYARSNDRADGFEPQRNLIRSKAGLDGGGSIAADARGNVYVAWHAPAAKGAGEQSRQVWLVQSTDDGQAFSAERSISDGKTGACGCCGMRLLAAPDGDVYCLYRTANQMVHRDMTLIRFDPTANQSHSESAGKMEAGVCVMSTSALAATGGGVLGAWEINGQIYWANVSPDAMHLLTAVSVPGAGKDRKHPAVAAGSKGEAILVWTEGTGWNRGGSIAWQRYDANGRELGPVGRAENLPAWGAPAAFARDDGSFVIVY